MTEKARKQGNGVSPISGVSPPVHTQFGKPNGNPRHNGAWKKEDTPRYKLEQMMKLTEVELQDIIDDTSAPLFEHKLAIAIKDGNWTIIKEMTQEVYGKPKENVDVTSNGETIGKTVEVVWAKKKK